MMLPTALPFWKMAGANMVDLVEAQPILILWAEEKCLAAATIAASGAVCEGLVLFLLPPHELKKEDTNLKNIVYESEFFPVVIPFV